MFKTQLEVREGETPDIWALVAPLIWDDGIRRVIVPAGFLTDLASVPGILKAIPALDINGLSRSPAVLHDWLYRTHGYSRASSDKLFRQALASRGVGLIARRTFWAGVRIGGWRPWSHYPNGPQQSDFASVETFYAWQDGVKFQRRRSLVRFLPR